MKMPWEDDINWGNTATTIVKGEPMSDLIRREDAMRVIKDDWDASFSREDVERAEICKFHFIEISNIPTAEPKVGRWIPYKAYFGKKKDSWVDELKCSECGYGWGDEGYNYCPNCGAKME